MLFFGLGVLQLLLVLVVIGVPVGLLLLGVRALSRTSAPEHLVQARNRELEAELDSANRRIEEMEVKLIGMEEKLSFTHSLLESRRSEP